MDSLTTHEPYTLLSKRSIQLVFRPIQQVTNFNHLTKGALYALDLETNGLSPFRSDAKILCVAVAGADGVFVLDARALSTAELRDVCLALRNVRLIAHNLLFDSLWLEYLLGLDLTYEACTFVMLKLCANEGWEGQSWSLDVANTTILNTARNNKQTLDDLLTTHRIPKSRMWELADVAAEEFFTYCGNDAESCYELYHELVKQFDSKFGQGCLKHWYSLWHNELSLIREQQIRGLQIDYHTVHNYHVTLCTDIETRKQQFLTNSDVLAVASQLRDNTLRELKSREPVKKDLLKEHLRKEPPHRTKTGALTKRWQVWKLKLDELRSLKEPYNTAWLNWNERYQEVCQRDLTEWFNINSLDHLKLLFYDKLKYEPIKTTASGEPSLDNKALRFLGDLGQLLLAYKELAKEEAYVRGLLEALSEDHVLRPGFKIFGTITGRISAGGM